jgi:hypothetical protein
MLELHRWALGLALSPRNPLNSHAFSQRIATLSFCVHVSGAESSASCLVGLATCLAYARRAMSEGGRLTLGIILALCAGATLSLSMVVQRYGEAGFEAHRPPPRPPPPCRASHPHIHTVALSAELDDGVEADLTKLTKVSFIGGLKAPRVVVWVLGLVIYGAANGFYGAAQVYGPLSVMAGE